MSELQPDNVAVKDDARPPSTSVVTDETGPEGSAEAAASEDTGSKTQTDDSAPSDDKPKPTRNRQAERKIRTLARKLTAAEKQNETLTGQVAELGARVDALANPKPPEPKLEDFDTPQEYGKAYSTWSADSPAKPTLPIQPSPPETAPDQPRPPDGEMQKFREAGTEKFGDPFLEAMSDATMPISQTMGDYLLDSKYGPDMYLHLADNTELATEIYNKGPYAAVKRLEALEKKAKAGKLDLDSAELKVEPEPSAEPPETKDPPVATKAPEPPKDQDDRGTVTLPADPENESMDSYAARRGKELQAQGYR